MRISTVTMYQQSINALNQQQSEYSKIGLQLASGKRVTNPSDDPQAASQAVVVEQSQAVNQQYTDARVSTRNALSQEESVLNSVGDALISVKGLLVQAGNGTLSDADRSSIASDLKGIYQTLIGQANATDGNGRYLFGGYQDSSPPFVSSNSGQVQYVGDTGQLRQQVDASRQMPSNDSGQQIFLNAHNSAQYVARAGSGNTGSVTFTGPSVVDTTAAGFGSGFVIAFDGAGNYSVDGGTPQPYTSGNSVTINGMSLTLQGAPAAGDTISVTAGHGYLAQGSAGNTGSLSYGSLSVSNASDPNFGTPFNIVFDGAGNYSTDGGATSQPYVPGQTISANGLSLTVQGTPAAGDSISVGTSGNSTPNIFRTLEQVITALDQPATTAADKANVQNTLSTASRELDNSLDNVLTTRASVGSRLNELDVIDSVGSNRKLSYAQTLSDLVDLDYNQAISDYSLRQVGLQAAQKAYVGIQSLSLFKLI